MTEYNEHLHHGDNIQREMCEILHVFISTQIKFRLETVETPTPKQAKPLKLVSQQLKLVAPKYDYLVIESYICRIDFF